MTYRRLIYFLLVLPVPVLVLWGVAAAYDRVSERQVTYRYITDALSPLETNEGRVTWLPPEQSLSRPFSNADAEIIGDALTIAWESLAVAQATGVPDVLPGLFGGEALARARKSVADATQYGGHMNVLEQTARPVFYLRDGALFQAEVELLTARYLVEDDTLRHFDMSRDQGIVTMLNESTGWRIFSYERHDTASVPPAPTPPRWTDTPIRGINYYPVATPWSEFWTEFDSAATNADFKRIHDLGANAIRVFLTRSVFVDEATAEPALQKLAELLALARWHDLYVVATLFDLKPDYGPASWAIDTQYLHRVLPLLAREQGRVLVDIKNEPDLDFAAHGTGTTTAWLTAMAANARRIAPSLPLTIGWSDPAAAHRLADRMDVISYHEYGLQTGTADRLRAVQAMAPGKPVYVTEIGSSSFELALGFPGSPQAQARALQDRMTALSDADGVMMWTLFDFERTDRAAVGRSPWNRKIQSEFGLLTSDGTEKPAVRVVRDHFTTAMRDTAR